MRFRKTRCKSNAPSGAETAPGSALPGNIMPKGAGQSTACAFY
ncbi:hypothetical protein CLOSTASPAR_00264 [[Clostridium] asparagiforme DSM 15981]|uniref:Uncharacterized protein n=1 Tax=[Clostridium] asparagiforme DSM 15981 TaxID=518636 RepID=C0CTG6_9FIRM|nr:hypothetical protein CLOSTASPAR_00264 [[Clostridium] asparagiforme DSM 15981]